jgi:hypothetical protein
VKYFLSISFLIVIACNNRGNSSTADANDSPTIDKNKNQSSVIVRQLTDTALELKIEDSLIKLPFVKKSNDYIDSISDHKPGIMFIVDSADNQIAIMAGYDGTYRFETYYNFIVDPKTLD